MILAMLAVVVHSINKIHKQDMIHGFFSSKLMRIDLKTTSQKGAVKVVAACLSWVAQRAA
jgi:hypothetical protein